MNGFYARTFGRTRLSDLGFIPTFLSLNDPRPAKEQFDDNYQHGGGWRPIKGYTILNPDGYLLYPGDPVLKPIAEIVFRDETIRIYDYAIVCIVQPDGSFEVSRMD